MLLLNAVRAAKWKPLYLTDVSKVNGSIKRDLTAGLSLPFGKVNHGTGANYVATAGTTFSVNPTFEVNVLNTQGFMKGFLQPVSPEMLAYFWNQGWPVELLLHLFVLDVEEVTITSGVESPPKHYRNHPQFESQDDNQEYREFAAWVTRLVKGRARFIEEEGPDAAVGPPVKLDSATKLEALVSVAKEGLVLETAGGEGSDLFQLKRTRKAFRLAHGTAPAGKVWQSEFDKRMGGVSRATPSADYQLRVQGLGDTEGVATRETLHLRSPQDVLYYIGQIIRLEAYRRQVPQLLHARTDGSYEAAPLFVAFPEGHSSPTGGAYPSCGETAVSVTDSDGDRFVVPAGRKWPSVFDAASPGPDGSFKYLADDLSCDGGMSVDVLSILSQLIALHKEAKDFPSTGLVRVIGQ